MALMLPHILGSLIPYAKEDLALVLMLCGLALVPVRGCGLHGDLLPYSFAVPSSQFLALILALALVLLLYGLALVLVLYVLALVLVLYGPALAPQWEGSEEEGCELHSSASLAAGSCGGYVKAVLLVGCVG